MIVMPANSTGIATGYLAGRYPGLLGHLFSPGAQRGPWPFMPYALDNGAFGAFTNGCDWDQHAWRSLLNWARDSGQAPRWALVPDVVGDKDATLARWKWCAPIAATYGWPLAFAAQDGMTAADVPKDAAVVFVGGSTDWKRETLRMWCANFPRVHVGRINSYRWLRVCEDAGAESVDGTGWFRGEDKGLVQWLAETTGEKPREIQQSLFCDDSDDATAHGSKLCATAGPAPLGAGK